MYRPRGELLSGAALSVQERVGVGLGRERDRIPQRPDRRRFAEDSKRVGFTERAHRGRVEMTEGRNARWPTRAEEHELLPEPHGVPRPERGRVAFHAVDAHGATAHAPHVHSLGCRLHFELSARQGGRSERLGRVEAAGARSKEAKVRVWAVRSPTDHLSCALRRNDRELADARRLVRVPGDDEHRDVGLWAGAAVTLTLCGNRGGVEVADRTRLTGPHRVDVAMVPSHSRPSSRCL